MSSEKAVQLEALEAHMAPFGNLQKFIREHKQRSFLAGFHAAAMFFMELEKAKQGQLKDGAK